VTSRPAAGGAGASSAVDRELARIEYPQVRERVRDLMLRAIPAGATALVVSKGDGELLQIEGRTGWHFPRADNGQYAGFHPRSGRDAVSHLEELRAAGAGYLVVPSTYSWWFEHYPELTAHLESHYRQVAGEANAGAVFALHESAPEVEGAEGVSSSGRARPAVEAHRPLLPAIRGLAASLLPEDAVVLVASEGDDELLQLGRAGWHFPRDERGRHVPLDQVDDVAAIAQLEALRDRGAHYLLIPRTGFVSIEQRDGLRGYLERSCRTVAMRERICALFELGGVAEDVNTQAERAWGR
jgi:hypothetical protein